MNTFIFLLGLQTLILITALTSSTAMLIDITVYLIDKEDKINAASWVIPSILWGIVYFISQILNNIKV